MTQETTNFGAGVVSALGGILCALLFLAACSSDRPARSSTSAPVLTSTATAPVVTLAPTAIGPTATPAADPASSQGGSGPVVFVWRTSGDAQHRLNRPAAMATDKNGDLYIVDGTNHRVQKVSGDGTFLTAWGSMGEGDGQFRFRRGADHPGGIAVDAQGTVLVADDNGRVQEFDRNGVFLSKWGGGRGTGDGQFDEPTGVAVAPDGSIYIADQNNNRIQKFDASGKFLSKWGRRAAARPNLAWQLTSPSMPMATSTLPTTTILGFKSSIRLGTC